jgi:hypothetical protein
MRQFYIPEIGDEIKLVADWTFDLYNEDRNSTLMEVMHDPREATWSGDENFGSLPCTIPAGAILKIDRIYIRKGLGEYSSLSFLWKDMRTNSRVEERIASCVQPSRSLFGSPERISLPYLVKKPARPVRFWAKLNDVNKIEFEQV